MINSEYLDKAPKAKLPANLTRTVQRRRALINWVNDGYVHDIITPDEMMGITNYWPTIIINAQLMTLKELYELIDRSYGIIIINWSKGILGGKIRNQELLGFTKKSRDGFMVYGNMECDNILPIKTPNCGTLNCYVHRSGTKTTSCYDLDCSLNDIHRMVEKSAINSIITECNNSTKTILGQFMSFVSGHKLKAMKSASKPRTYAKFESKATAIKPQLTNKVFYESGLIMDFTTTEASVNLKHTLVTENHLEAIEFCQQLPMPFNVVIGRIKVGKLPFGISHSTMSRTIQRICSSQFGNLKIMDILNHEELQMLDPSMPTLVLDASLLTYGELKKVMSTNNYVLNFSCVTNYDFSRAKAISEYDNSKLITINCNVINIEPDIEECNQTNCCRHKSHLSFGCYTADLNGDHFSTKVEIAKISRKYTTSAISLGISIGLSIINPISLIGVVMNVNKIAIDIVNDSYKYNFKPIQGNDKLIPITIQKVVGSDNEQQSIEMVYASTGAGKTHKICSQLENQKVIYMTKNIIKTKPNKLIDDRQLFNLNTRKATVLHLNKFSMQIVDILSEYEEPSAHTLIIDDCHLYTMGQLMAISKVHKGPIHLTYGSDQQGNNARCLDLFKGIKLNRNGACYQLSSNYLKRSVVGTNKNSDLCGTINCQLHKTTSGIICYDEDVETKNNLRAVNSSIIMNLIISTTDNLVSLGLKGVKLYNNINE